MVNIIILGPGLSFLSSIFGNLLGLIPTIGLQGVDLVSYDVPYAIKIGKNCALPPLISGISMEIPDKIGSHRDCFPQLSKGKRTISLCQILKFGVDACYLPGISMFL